MSSKACAELYEPLAEEKGLALSIAPGRTAPIRGNVRLISQALANLVDNAIKYTPEGGRIAIAAEDRPTGVALSVADTGPGIPADERSRVLERFVRLEESRNSPGTGPGPQPGRRRRAPARCQARTRRQRTGPESDLDLSARTAGRDAQGVVISLSHRARGLVYLSHAAEGRHP